MALVRMLVICSTDNFCNNYVNNPILGLARSDATFSLLYSD